MIAVVHFTPQIGLNAIETTIEIGALTEAQAAAAITSFEEVDASHLISKAAHFTKSQAAAALPEIDLLHDLRLARIDVFKSWPEGRGVGRAGEAHGRGDGGKGGDSKSLFHN